MTLKYMIQRVARYTQIAETSKLNSMEILKSYNVQIWCGLKESYNDNKVNSIDDVREVCDQWVNYIKDCVSITPTEFRYVDGSEPGVIVGYIQYPRFPREEQEIKRRALRLAEKLMIALKQNRVTVVTPEESIMIKNN